MQWATKDTFFAATVPRERMDIPNIGWIWVYGLTTGEKDDYQNRIRRISGRQMNIRLENARAMLLIMVVRDSQGRRLFTEKDVGKVLEIPSQVTEPILDKAWALSGLDAGEVEEMVKNSPSGPEPPSFDSSTGSPAT